MLDRLDAVPGLSLLGRQALRDVARTAEEIVADHDARNPPDPEDDADGDAT